MTNLTKVEYRVRSGGHPFKSGQVRQQFQR